MRDTTTSGWSMKCSKPSCTGSRGLRAELPVAFRRDRNPCVLHRLQTHRRKCRLRPDLPAWIDHPSPADPIDPRSAGEKRRVVNVPREHDVRLEAHDPLDEKLVAAESLARPAHR